MKTQVKCPVCGQHHDYLVHNFHPDMDQPLLESLQEEVPVWRKEMGACTRCLDQAHLELQRCFFKGKGEPGEVNGYKILPTPVRLMANENLSGDSVTICMIDSGFYPHPDLISTNNRILAHLDVPKNFSQLPTSPLTPYPLTSNLWHGTMTTVVAAGNGHLSGGIYRGIANKAKLVLLKVMEEGVGISEANIVKAIDWAIANHKRYNIRIINLSVYDDQDISYQHSKVDKAVERAFEKGITVVAAAGNDPNAPLRPPANSPHAITVGGLNDRNTLEPLTNTLYHSTYGETVDRFQKPDIIAPAIWLAAPILPGSVQQREAAALFDLAKTSNAFLGAKLANLLPQTKLDKRLLSENADTIKEAIADRIADTKFISPHYQHADGTSFAAPIVSSVVAQMLEANPNLDPATIREIILVTAKKLPGENADRQGWGVIQPAHAVQMASGQPLSPLPGLTPVVDYRRMVIDFYVQNLAADSVLLTGDFLQWSSNGLPLSTNGVEGQWKASFPFTRNGVYRYKFLINNREWMSDPRNFFRENDGFGGFNSKLIIG
ncbi:MAG: S8 family serine peptidase [Lewinellaceae bacterium]|nr:S8 family serine peptidase [Saprospiraceae bacterium]MCB9340188.1 S8 family serine peptidase [Lewinellaceae bacterium]